MLPAVPSTPSTGDTALTYLRRRARLLVRLTRVNAALRRWHEREADACLPADLRRSVPMPTLPREALEGLHRLLVEELGLLAGP